DGWQEGGRDYLSPMLTLQEAADGREQAFKNQTIDSACVFRRVHEEGQAQSQGRHDEDIGRKTVRPAAVPNRRLILHAFYCPAESSRFIPIRIEKDGRLHFAQGTSFEKLRSLSR